MRIIKILNLLSIDVALGAAISAAFFARILNVTVLPQGYILLALIVWLIYTADHLLDAFSMKQAATTERHLFHQKHFITILLFALAGGLIAIGLMFIIRVQLITTGIVLGVFVITYLVVNRWLKYFKELTGTLLYTGGVMLPAWSLHQQSLTNFQAGIIITFALIAFTNMLIFAALSRDQDSKNNQRSLATALVDNTMTWLIRFVMLISFGTIAYGMVHEPSTDWIVLLSMELTLVLIAEIRYFRFNDRYRIFGDAVFLFTMVLLI